MKSHTFKVLCLVVLCLGTLTLAASAASLENDAAAVAGYCQGDRFFAFVSMEDEWPESVTVKAQLGGKTQAYSMEKKPSRLEDGEQPVSYLLLVDRSGSMLGKRNDKNPQNAVQYFTEALCDAAGGNAKFAVATFDKNFNDDASEFTDRKRTVLEKVRSIRYDAQETDLTQSTIEALEYLEGYQRETGELVNLVLITDGIPDGGQERKTLAVAFERIRVSPSILVHTFGIGTSDAKSPDALNSLAQLGQGVHATALNGRQENAEQAAQETANLVNRLYPLRFSLGQEQSEVTDAMIYFYEQGVEENTSSPKLTKLTNVPVLGPAGEVVSEAEPKPVRDVYLPSTETPEEASAAVSSSDPSEEESGTDSDTEAPADRDAGNTSKTGSSSAGGAKQSGEKDRKVFTPIVISLAVLAVLVLLVYLVLRRKRSNSDAGVMEIYMRLEVLAGQVATMEEDFYLSDELIIGRARNCDIVLKEPGLAKRCARIFLSDHMIWIEDIGSPDGVYLGGMRLYNANRLRSGDEISIGNARFQFKF